MTNKSIRFKVGMIVVITSDVTGCGAGDKVTSFGYKKGDSVELIRYDSSDKTWRVKKADTSSIWIKRKNLAPLTPVETPPFKIGDKVVLINKDSRWAKSDSVTTGKEYTVKQCSQDGYIKVTGNDAIGTMWIETEDFKLAPVVESPLFKVGDKVQYVPNPKSQYSDSDYYAQKDGLIPGNIYTVSKSHIAKLSDYGDIQWVQIKEGGLKFNLAADCFALAVTEPKKRMAVCVDISDSTADYEVGMTYEITDEDSKYFFFKNKSGGMFKWRFKEIMDEQTPATTEATKNPFKVGDRVRLVRFESGFYDKDYFMKHDELTIGGEYEVTDLSNNGGYPDNTFIDLKGKTYHHPYDCFELVIPLPSKYTIEVVCNENDGYEGRLTIGKTYMAKLNSKNTAEAPEKDLYDIETNDRGTATTTAFCSRFTVVLKVGHTLTAEWFNNFTPKDFYGFITYDGSRNKWETNIGFMIHGDRKIERIEVVGGRLAALISDTRNIWIAVESITTRQSKPIKHVIPDIAKEIPAPVMGKFLMELTTLMEKYK